MCPFAAGGIPRIFILMPTNLFVSLDVVGSVVSFYLSVGCCEHQLNMINMGR